MSLNQKIQSLDNDNIKNEEVNTLIKNLKNLYSNLKTERDQFEEEKHQFELEKINPMDKDEPLLNEE